MALSRGLEEQWFIDDSKWNHGQLASGYIGYGSNSTGV